MFTRYKTPAFVNLDFKVTFTPELLRKDMDLGLDLSRSWPCRCAGLSAEQIQSLIGHGLRRDFAATGTAGACIGIELEPEHAAVDDGL